MDNSSSQQKFLSVLLARASKISGSSNLDTKLYRKIGLLETKLLTIKSQDILEDLTDIEYLSKLEAKSKKLVKDLSQKKIIPAAPGGLLNSDFNALKKLIAFFDTEDWKTGKRKLKTIRKKLLSSSEPIQKSDLKNFLNFTSIFQDTLKEKCQKFEALNKDDFWVDKTSIETLLVEYSILLTGKPLSNPQTGSELHEILEGVNKFEANWLKKLDDLNSKTNEFLERWNNVKSNESKLDSILKNGQIEEVRSVLEESVRFTDLNLKIRAKVKLYEDIKKKGGNLEFDCKEFLKNSHNDKIWASKNAVLSNKISQSLITIQDWASQLDTETATGLKLDLDLIKWKDLAEETKAEVSKSKEIADDLAKAKKRKKNIFIFLVLATGAGLFYFFEKDNREKQLLKLQTEADSFGVGIHVLESAFDEDKIPPNFTGWRLLRDKDGFGYNLSYNQKGIRDGLYCELYQSSKKPKEKGQYINGKKNGLWETWHPEGNKESEGNYTYGEKDGTWLYFASDGTREKMTHKTKATIQIEQIAEAKRKDEARLRQIEEERRIELAEIAERQRAEEEARQRRLILQEREKNASEHASLIVEQILNIDPKIKPKKAEFLAWSSKALSAKFPDICKNKVGLFSVVQNGKLNLIFHNKTQASDTDKISFGEIYDICTSNDSYFNFKWHEGNFFRSEKSKSIRFLPIKGTSDDNRFTVFFGDVEGSPFQLSPKPIKSFGDFKIKCFYNKMPGSYSNSAIYILENDINFLNDPRLMWFEFGYISGADFKKPADLSKKQTKEFTGCWFIGEKNRIVSAKCSLSELNWYAKVDYSSLSYNTKEQTTRFHYSDTNKSVLEISSELDLSIFDVFDLNPSLNFQFDRMVDSKTGIKIPDIKSGSGTINPSHLPKRGDYVFNSKGEITGIMVNSNYLYLLNSDMIIKDAPTKSSYHSKFGDRYYGINFKEQFNFYKMLKEEVK